MFKTDFIFLTLTRFNHYPVQMEKRGSPTPWRASLLQVALVLPLRYVPHADALAPDDWPPHLRHWHWHYGMATLAQGNDSFSAVAGTIARAGAC